MKKNYNFISIAILLIVIILAGCKKDSLTPAKVSTATNQSKDVSVINDSLVATPGGWLPKSHVFTVEDGNHLLIQDGQILKVHTASGKILSVLGKTDEPGIKAPPKGMHNLSSSSYPGDDGWVAYTSWNSVPSAPINYFSTNWTVPGNPTTTYNGQLIYIFNALGQGGTINDILQPVLQWGVSPAGGGNYWSIGNWYGWANNRYFAHTSLVTVTTNTNLQGIISNTSNQTDGSHNFAVGFYGYSNGLIVVEGAAHSGTDNNVPTTLHFPFIGPEIYANETIETYNSVNYHNGNGAVNSTDYPPGLDVQMTNIKLLTNNSPASPLSWSAQSGTWAVFGEHAKVISYNSSGSGEVDLYFHPEPVIPPTPTVNINGMSAVSFSGPYSGSGYIHAPANTTVNLTVSGYGPSTSYHSAVFSLQGATLSGTQGNTLNVNNGSITRTFVMPTSGSVTWSGSFYEGDTSGFGNFGVN